MSQIVVELIYTVSSPSLSTRSIELKCRNTFQLHEMDWLSLSLRAFIFFIKNVQLHPIFKLHPVTICTFVGALKKSRPENGYFYLARKSKINQRKIPPGKNNNAKQNIRFTSRADFRVVISRSFAGQLLSIVAPADT